MGLAKGFMKEFLGLGTRDDIDDSGVEEREETGVVIVDSVGDGGQLVLLRRMRECLGGKGG